MERDHVSEELNLPSIDIFEKPFSRRNFLKLLPAVAFGAVALTTVGEKSIEAYLEQQSDWEKANMSNDEFLAAEKNKIKNLIIGCSFSPEQINNPQLAHDIAKFAVEELNIKNIRLGLRWTNSVNNNNEIDLAFYESFLNYFFDKNVNLTINSGIKVFRWPEVHVPDIVLNKLRQIPPDKAIIKNGSEIAKRSLDHSDELFNALKSKYSLSDLSHVTTIQPENEPGDRFGPREWTIDSKYLEDYIALSKEHFPNAQILVNSGNILNQLQISNLLQRLSSRYKGLISGVDFYPRNPFISGLPIVGNLGLDSVSISKAIIIDPYKINQNNSSYKVEVTEGQAEPWNNNFTSPGNSAREFKNMLLRSMRGILRMEEPSILNIWGIEYLGGIALSKKQTTEHMQIFDLIQKINFQQVT